MFLLKGHEDLRQDERVMQLFSLVNTLLIHDPETFRRNLTIQVCFHMIAKNTLVHYIFLFRFGIHTEICSDSLINKQWINWLGSAL